MPLQAKNYDPAIMAGANIDVAVDLTDIADQNGNEVIEIDGETSAVNYIGMRNAPTGSAVLIESRGSDTNVGMDVSTKGTGSFIIWTGALAREAAIFVNTASAVNEITVTPAATGGNPDIAATGNNTNINLSLTPKGTAVVFVGNSATGTVASGSATINAQRGAITTASLTTGTSTVATFDLVNNKITPDSQIIFTVVGGTNTAGIPVIGAVTPITGSATVNVANASYTAAFNGTLRIAFVITR